MSFEIKESLRKLKIFTDDSESFIAIHNLADLEAELHKNYDDEYTKNRIMTMVIEELRRRYEMRQQSSFKTNNNNREMERESNQDASSVITSSYRKHYSSDGDLEDNIDSEVSILKNIWLLYCTERKISLKSKIFQFSNLILYLFINKNF